MDWRNTSLADIENLFRAADADQKLIYRREIQSVIRTKLSDRLRLTPSLPSDKQHYQEGSLKCFIFVNGLAEWYRLNPKKLAERSHFQLLIDIYVHNMKRNVSTTFVDIRHPARCGLFASRETREDYEIFVSLPFDSNTKEEDIVQTYKKSTELLTGTRDEFSPIDFKVIATSSDKTLVQFIQHAYSEVQLLFESVKNKAYSIHAGGVFLPYFLEGVLQKQPGNHYFYQFTHLNTTFFPSEYTALLSPRTDLPVHPTSQHLLRPGNIVLSEKFEDNDQNCVDKLAPFSGKKIILSIGTNVASRINSSYIQYLHELKVLSPGLVYAYFSASNKKPSSVNIIENLGIETINVGYAPNLFQCLKKLKNLNIVVFNPRHFGNGGCLLQAAQAEIPVIVCEGNDSGNWHPNNHIVKTEVDAVMNTYDLFNSKIFRSHWITDSLQKIKNETTKCENSLDTIISKSSQKQIAEKIFVVGNNKTGTTSLQKFLNSIGYHVAPQPPAVRMYVKHLAGQINIWPDLSLFIEKYDGFQDLPFADTNLLEQLVERYPKARFIYSMRDTSAWYNSLLKHHSRIFKFQIFDDGGVLTPSNQQQMIQNLKNSKLVEEDALSIGEIHMLRLGLENEEELFNREIYIKYHAEHEKNALKILREKDHLLIDVTRDTRIEMKICDFLGIEQPSDQKFPHMNRDPGLVL